MFKSKFKPSEILIRHVEGRAGGYELDDMLTSGRYHENYDDLAAPLMDINGRYSSAEYPIGLMNPDSFPEIRTLAKNLALIGL